MINIFFYGKLAKRFGKTFTLGVDSAKEAVHALSLTVHGFKDEFMRYDYSVYSIIEGKNVSLDSDDISAPLICNNLHFKPIISGKKSNTQKGAGKLIIAAALFFVAGPVGEMVAAAGQSAQVAISAAKVTDAISSIALMTAFRGVSLMLTPKEVEDVESKSISSENSATNGSAVPLAYGEGYFDVIPVSVLISSNGVTSFGTPTLGTIDWQTIDVE